MEKKNVTFSDIAKYTNFSKTTISRYFNNPDSLTLENQQIIANALEALNYKENKVARILANGKTEFIGVIVPNLYLHYYSEILNQILSTYENFGYKFLVFAGNEHEDTERKYIQELLAYKIEGMIILSHTIPSEELASYHIPIVTIEREDKYVCSVNTDNYMVGIQATSLPHDLILTDTGHSYEESSLIIRRLLDEIDEKYKGKIKGIFLSNDTFANILLNHLIQRYGKLPEDYKIIGFDDSPISREAIIPTSTVGQQIDKIAHTTMEILTEQINERHKRKPVISTTPIHKVITPILINRETTKPVFEKRT